MSTNAQMVGNSLGEALRAVHEGQVKTRAELTTRLGITRGTAGTVVGELVDLEWIELRNLGKPGVAGRPSPTIVINADGPKVAAVQLHSRALTVALVGLGAQISALSETKLPTSAGPEDVAATAADEIAQLVGTRSNKTKKARTVSGVGVVVPSAVRLKDGVALGATNLGWPRSVPFRDLLAAALRRRGMELAVTVENDVNSALLAEHRHGVGRGSAHLLGLTTARTGVGGALVLDGQIQRGADGYAMGVGHLSVNPVNGRGCTCGNRGCLNVEADNVALVENAGGVALGDLDSAITGILAGVNESTTDAAAVNDVMKALVNGLVDLVNLFNPDRILLGGLFSELLNQYRDELVKAVVQRSYSGRDSAPEFATHSLDRACVLGAAEAAWEPFLSSPRTVRN